MSQPTVSVIIPAYNQAAYLGEAVQSVLDQTYPYFEVIVVNDASRDNTEEIACQFNDPRTKYVAHKQNRGLAAARNTGIRAATGELLAFLDADDMFHPHKLEAHVSYMEKHPEIGVTYNSRFEFVSVGNVLSLWRPPLSVTLSDLVLGFPFAPSDMVVRKDWAFRINLLRENYVFFGEDLDFNCRLALDGCQFVRVDRTLNYRRYYTGRTVRDIPKALYAMTAAVESALADTRCPERVRILRPVALANLHAFWAYHAFAQGETLLGQRLIRRATQLDQTMIDNGGAKLLETIVFYGIQDGGDHETALRRVLAQLPAELAWLSEQSDRAVARGHALRGVRAVMWGRPEDGHKHFGRAKSLAVRIDEPFLGWLTQSLLDYENEFGKAATGIVLHNLSSYLVTLGGWQAMRWLKGCYSINSAFESYRGGRLSEVPVSVLRAMANKPEYVLNRGAWSMLIRSTANRMRNAGAGLLC